MYGGCSSIPQRIRTREVQPQPIESELLKIFPANCVLLSHVHVSPQKDSQPHSDKFTEKVDQMYAASERVHRNMLAKPRIIAHCDRILAQTLVVAFLPQ